MQSHFSVSSCSPRYYVGLDVHRDTISACTYDADSGHVCDERTFSIKSPQNLAQFVDTIRSHYGDFRCCYEASYSATAVYEAMAALGVDCAIIAPSSIPRCSRDRIKTDRRDARKLAKYFATGLLTECFVPDQELISARSLVRRRTTQMKSLHRSKMQVIHFLHARGHTYNEGRYWTQRFMRWIAQVHLDQPYDEQILRGDLEDIAYTASRIRALEQQIQIASELPRFQEQVQILQGFRGIGSLTAMQLTCEIGDFRRFKHPTSLMAYLGLVPSQHSSGNTIRTGTITKTGNAHARKALVGAAWKYTSSPRTSVALSERQKQCSPKVLTISQRAQKRLYSRFVALNKRKSPKIAVVAITRELVGFLWEATQVPIPTA